MYVHYSVEEWEINKRDYITLIYHSMQMDDVSKTMNRVQDDFQSAISRDSGHMTQYGAAGVSICFLIIDTRGAVC